MAPGTKWATQQMSPPGDGSRQTADATNRWRWPDDYLTWDEGRLRVRHDFGPIFAQRGWQSVAAIMSSTDCEILRRLPDRENGRVRLPRPDGSGSVCGFLKRHRGPKQSLPANGVARPVDLNFTPGLAEAEAVGHCQRHQVPTMAILAAGGWFNPDQNRYESFFLSEAIEAGVPADQFWQARFQPTAQADDAADRQALLAAMARTARHFHASGAFHLDFYWCHFFVREVPHLHAAIGANETGEPCNRRSTTAYEALLIDLQRLNAAPWWWTWRWRLKDLAQFRFSMPTGLLTAAERRYWYEQYLGRPCNWWDRLWWLLIELRAAAYRRREKYRAKDRDLREGWLYANSSLNPNLNPQDAPLVHKPNVVSASDATNADGTVPYAGNGSHNGAMPGAKPTIAGIMEPVAVTERPAQSTEATV